MAQIPDFETFGPRPTPTPSYRRVYPDESGQIIAGAGAQLGRTLEDVGNQAFQQQSNMARAQAENALLDHQIAIKTTTQDIGQQVQSGQLPYDQAQQAFDDATAKLKTPTIAGLTPVDTENFNRGIQRNTFAGQTAMTGIVRAGRSQAFKDQFGSALDKLDKLAGMPGADIQSINQQADSYRQMGLDADVPPAVVDHTIQTFKDRNWLNQATQRAMESKESLPALRALQHDLTATDGFYAGRLDTEKRNIVLRSVENDQIILQNRIEHEQDKREAKAQGALGRIDEQIASGVPATPDMWAQWGATVKGTSFEDEFKQRLDDETKVQEVLRKPIDEQMKFVQDKTQQLDQEGGSLRDLANLHRLSTAVNQNVNLLQKAPLLFAANRNGTQVPPLDTSTLSSPDGQQQFQGQIADRMATLKAMRAQYGSSVASLPLLPQEAAQLSGQLESVPPLQRAQLLVSLRGAMNDDVAYQAAMHQIAPRSPVTAIAGSMVGASAPAATPSWFDRAYAPQLTDVERILHGEALLNPASGGKEAQAEQESGKGALRGGMPMPEDKGITGLRAQYAQAAGDRFRGRPELADAHYSVFKDAYAALLAENGDMKGVGDPALAKQALRIALGNPVTFNGNTFTAPAGMDPSQFPGFVREAVASTAGQLKAPPDWQDRIRGYGIQELGGLGSGRYVLTNGNTPLLRPDGKGYFTIDLRDQYLGARGAHRGSPDFDRYSPTNIPDQVASLK